MRQSLGLSYCTLYQSLEALSRVCCTRSANLRELQSDVNQMERLPAKRLDSWFMGVGEDEHQVKAAVFTSAHATPTRFVEIKDVPRPQFTPGYLLLRVVACGVCRTDLHIVEGDLSPLKEQLIPGTAAGSARRCFLDRRSGWRLLVLSSHNGKSV